jgi:site-specific DNA-methyltransferase (adenine-specific)
MHGLQITQPYFYYPNFVLYHGDAVKLLAKIHDNSVDMVFADPPYNLSNGGMSVHSGKRVSVNKGSWDKSKGTAEEEQVFRVRFGFL